MAPVCRVTNVTAIDLMLCVPGGHGVRERSTETIYFMASAEGLLTPYSASCDLITFYNENVWYCIISILYSTLIEHVISCVPPVFVSRDVDINLVQHNARWNSNWKRGLHQQIDIIYPISFNKYHVFSAKPMHESLCLYKCISAYPTCIDLDVCTYGSWQQKSLLCDNRIGWSQLFGQRRTISCCATCHSQSNRGSDNQHIETEIDIF